MHTITISPARAGALLTALEGLHDQLIDTLVAGARHGDTLAAELAELRLEIVDGLLEEIAARFPLTAGWHVDQPEPPTRVVVIREVRQ